MPIPARAGASGDIFNHAEPNKVSRSVFDLSRITTFTADSGMIVPFDWFITLPGDDFTIDSEISLQTLPSVTGVLTPYKVKLHWHHLNMSDIWTGWNTFITKGRSGNVTLRVPQFACSANTYNGVKYYDDSPHSLASYLGKPPYYSYSDITKNYLPYVSGANPHVTGYPTQHTKMSALPFMAYQSICKYNYVPQNLLQDNTALYPVEGDTDWRLPYNIDNVASDNLVNTVSGKYLNNQTWTTDTMPFNFDGIYRSTDTEVALGQLRYATFDNDYFTTALPWLQRGSVKELDMSLNMSDVTIPSLGLQLKSGNTFYPLLNTVAVSGGVGFSGADTAGNYGFDKPVQTVPYTFGSSESVGSSITANQLRELIAISVWQERNAKVNGSYNSMIWVHWSQNPHSAEHMPEFVGGSSSYVQFSEVLQTSQSSESSALGQTAGRGNMYDSSNVGRYHSQDYGIMMGIMIISPMTSYNSAMEHSLIAESLMEDFPQPEFESLSPQPIINGEIYPSDDDVEFNDLFGYQERYSYLKSRYNVNRGLFRLKPSDDILFSSATQSREFDSVPKLSYQFVVNSPDNTRRDWLAYPSQPTFKVQIASKVKAVRNLSYNAVANTFGF